MRNKFFLALLVASFAMCSGAFASSDSGQPAPDSTSASAAASAQRPEGPSFSHRPGIGFKTSLIGFGGDFAVPVSRRSNVRVGFSAFNYSRGFDKDGVSYSGKLGLNSVQALYDIFPFGAAGDSTSARERFFITAISLAARQLFRAGNRSRSAGPTTSAIRAVLFPEMGSWRSARPDQCSYLAGETWLAAASATSA